MQKLNFIKNCFFVGLFFKINNLLTQKHKNIMTLCMYIIDSIVYPHLYSIKKQLKIGHKGASQTTLTVWYNY